MIQLLTANCKTLLCFNTIMIFQLRVACLTAHIIRWYESRTYINANLPRDVPLVTS